MRINTNMAALNAWRNLTVNNQNMQKSLEKLSSGYRINRAADDAAGLAVSEKMRAQIRGLNQASSNAQDGIALVQTAEGGGGQIQSMLQRMRELTVQSANGGLGDSDRTQLNTEFSNLVNEIERTATSISYNNIGLLKGSTSTSSTTQTVLNSNATVGSFTASGATAGANYLVKTTQLADYAKTSTTNSFTAASTGTAATEGYVLKINGQTVYTAAAGATVDKSQIAAAINSDATLKATLSASYDANTGALSVKSLATGAGQSFTAKEFFSDGSTDLGAGNGIFGAGSAGITYSGQDLSYSVNGGGAKTSATNTAVDLGTAGATGVKADFTGLGTSTITVNSATSTSSTGTVDLSIQVGANSGDTLKLSINAMGKAALGIGSLDISTLGNMGLAADGSGTNSVLNALDTAINNVSSYRANLGAAQNRLENVVNTLTVQSENLTGAESRIRDVDMAAEMSNFTKNNILSQASQSMLAQANQSTQGILSLLRG